MSVRPDVAARLQTDQSQLGDPLLGAIPDPGSIGGFVLEHTGGMSAGGSMPLQTGSYRFGRSSSSVLLDAGATTDPQFGLTISPEGAVTLYPPTGGLTVDGQPITEPTPLKINQVIAVGTDRFVLSPSDHLDPATTSRPGGAEGPMPTKARGKAVDQPIIGWFEGRRNQAIQELWDGLSGPVEVHNRITENTLFQIDAQHRRFGHVLLGTAELTNDLPAEIAEANKATRAQVAEAFGTIPNAPVAVDLTKTSLAIVGPRDRSRALATWLALSLVTCHSPADLAMITRAPADPGFWTWLERFPHLASLDTAPLAVTISDERRGQTVSPQGSIALLSSRAEIPDEFGAVVELSDRSASFTNRVTGERIDELAIIGVANAVAVERSLMVAHNLPQDGTPEFGESGFTASGFTESGFRNSGFTESGFGNSGFGAST